MGTATRQYFFLGTIVVFLAIPLVIRAQASSSAFPPNISQFRLATTSKLDGPPVLPGSTQPAIASRITRTNYYEYTLPSETVQNWTQLVTVKQFTLTSGAPTDSDAKAIADTLGFSTAAYASGITTNVVDKQTYPASALAGAQSNIYVVMVYFVETASRIVETDIMRFYVKNGRVYEDIYGEQASLDSNPVVDFKYEAFAKTQFPDPTASTSVQPQQVTTSASVTPYVYPASRTSAQTTNVGNSGTQSNDQLQQELNALLAEIAALQQQLINLSNPASPTTVTNPPPAVSPTGLVPRCPPLNRSLSKGMRGQDVFDLQVFLDQVGFFFGTPTGFFGPTTEASVQEWQSAQGVIRSGTPESGFGVVGPRTRSAIQSRCDPSAPTSCPIAPQPTTACSAGWQAITDKYGCTTSYKCTFPLPKPN